MPNPTLVNSTSGQLGSGSTTVNVTLGWTITAGNTLFVITVANGTGTPSITTTDSNANTWAADVNFNDSGSGSSRLQISRTPITAGGASDIVHMAKSATCFLSYVIAEFTNVQSALDNSNSNINASSTAVSSGNVTQAAANDLFLFACTHEGSSSQSITENTSGANQLANFTNTTDQPLDVFWVLESATTNASWTLGVAAINFGMGASYKASAGDTLMAQCWC